MGDLFRINNNLSATFAQRQLNQQSGALDEAQQRLASGLRINSAADDAAGLAISEKMRTAQRGLNQAEANAQDGISVLQTAEGGLSSINDKLQRVRELSVQAANDSLTGDDRALIQEEVNELVDEIDRTASSVQFNNRQLLKNEFSTVDESGSVDTTTSTGSLTFHIGANRNETMTLDTSDIATTTSSTLGVRDSGTSNAIQVTTQALAESAIQIATTAINSISTTRASIGAVQNRLEGAIEFLQVQQENVQASESRIRDADVAQEAVNRTRANILVQAGTAVLAQSQQTPQLALQLL
jgi:flagellin